MSDQNRIRLIATEPIRGRIIDKNGEVLANSKLNYSLVVKPQIINQKIWDSYKYKLAKLLNTDVDKLDSKYNNFNTGNQRFSIKLSDSLSIEQLIRFKENERDFKGIEIAEKVVKQELSDKEKQQQYVDKMLQDATLN